MIRMWRLAFHDGIEPAGHAQIPEMNEDMPYWNRFLAHLRNFRYALMTPFESRHGEQANGLQTVRLNPVPDGPSI